MALADDVIPAAAHLAGPGSAAVLRAALAPLGAQLVTSRPCHVHYRPDSDVAVRYDTTVSWAGAPATPETLLAGVSRHGVPTGTLPVAGHTDEGEVLEVGVWRWPFDPHVPGLTDAVTPSRVGAFLGDLVAGRAELEVVAYRPTQRAVVRVRDERGRTTYVKALRPGDVGPLVLRHERLAAAGVPVPAVLLADEGRGLVALQALEGPTARLRYQRVNGKWPSPAHYLGVLDAIGAADLSTIPVRPGRLTDAVGHARMLERTAPAQRWRLETVVDAVRADRGRGERRHLAVHGDLYEAQLVTAPRSAAIVGVLDLDDAGPGDPLDDRATILAHLWVRSLDAPHRARLRAHIAELRDAFVTTDGPAELDVVTAAVLVGLATGPFRIQARGWRRQTTQILSEAVRLATATSTRRRSAGGMRKPSARPHARVTAADEPSRIPQ